MTPDPGHDQRKEQPAKPQPPLDDEPEVLPDDPDVEGLSGEDKLPG